MGNPLTDDIYTMKTTKTVSLEDGISWETAECPHCGASPMFVVATALDGNINVAPMQRTRWLRCTSCLRGSVNDRGALHPAPLPLRESRGLSADEERSWHEVRRCLGAGAGYATVLLCRATLRRLSIDSGMPDDAPLTFAAAVAHLAAEGFLTARTREWADRVVTATDDVDASAVDVALATDTATFTLRVLESYFEPDGSAPPEDHER